MLILPRDKPDTRRSAHETGGGTLVHEQKAVRGGGGMGAKLRLEIFSDYV
jgi:hypothetical protein